MDDLFEKLKSEPAVNNSKEELTPTLEPASKKICTEDISASPIREVSASPVFKSTKSRSNSPVAVNEKSKNFSSDINLIDEIAKKRKRSASRDSDSKEAAENETDATAAKESPKKQMPTKAQKKLFEIPTEESSTDDAVVKENTSNDVNATEAKDTTDTTAAKECKVKRCRVRIKRENLVRLREKFTREQATKKSKKKKSQQQKESPKKTLQKAGSKRKADAKQGSPPNKKAKSSGFFIKLNSNVKKSPPSPKEKQTNLSSSKKSPQTKRDTPVRKATPRVFNSTPVYTTKATKFTRTQLIRSFGKRYFNSRVRIERCRHPMMLTFESNARARKVQAKNKSKNLSVSFKEQVEIIGLSDTESYESDEVNNVTSSKGATEKLLAGATPLHLKKVENGKVIDDIEFDPKLFGDPDDGKNSSTPLRKKKERKSYSPLKDDSSPSARSEQLKLANEKLPPCALRRLSAEDEDDEDDECEWIVPIDIPARRLSRTNSTSDKDGKSSTSDDKVEQNADNDAAAKNNEKTEVFNTNRSKEKSTENFTASNEVKNADEKSNGNKAAEKNGKALENEEKLEHTEAKKLADDNFKNDSPDLLNENDSKSATPNPPFTPENHGTPDSLVKTAIDKLSEDIEKNESACKEITGTNASNAIESA